MAIREDEDVATAMGIDTARAKLLAFTLSAATGGVAGAIFAAKVGTVFPNSFTVFISINVLSLIIVGGIASNPGHRRRRDRADRHAGAAARILRIPLPAVWRACSSS